MKKLLSFLLMCLFASAASAASMNLKVTEIYAGNSGDNNATDDWIEITNYGTTAWDLETNPIYYDDGENNSLEAKTLKGLTSIAAGESVVYILGTDDLTEFQSIWGTGVNAGYAKNGAGLGKSGDGVYLYTTNSADIASFTSITYPALPETLLSTMVANANGDWDNNDVIFAQDGVLGAYQSNSFVMNDTGETATIIGSPGYVPEPASLSLMALAGMAALRRRK